MRKNIVVSAGGTGGHVFPALSFVNELKKDCKNCNYYFFTDTRVLSSNKFNLLLFNKSYKIQGAGIVNLSLIKKIFNTIKLGVGFLQSLYYLIKLKPKLIVAFGGYITLPVAIAGRVLKIPLVIHEQNKIPSSTNVLLAKIASSVAVSFKNTASFNNNNVIYTGMPIRDVFFNQSYNRTKVEGDKITIAFLGGSLGAKVFGANVAQAFTMLNKNLQKKFVVYHQCRKELENEVKEIWQQTNVELTIKPFFKDITNIMQQSNVIFTRSGASTAFEVMALGKYAIFIPFAGAANNHQYYNALDLVNNGLADLCLEKDFSKDFIYQKLQYIANNAQSIKQPVANTANGALELTKLCKKYIKS